MSASTLGRGGGAGAVAASALPDARRSGDAAKTPRRDGRIPIFDMYAPNSREESVSRAYGQASVYSIDGMTRSGGLCPSMKVFTLTMTFSPMSMRPSTVAEPMWGSSTTLGSFRSLGLMAGSCS